MSTPSHEGDSLPWRVGTLANWGLYVSDHIAPNGARIRSIKLPKFVSSKRVQAGQGRARRRLVTFRQKDLERVPKAARDAGIQISRIDVDLAAGKVTISTGPQGNSPTAETAYDDWMANRVRAS